VRAAVAVLTLCALGLTLSASAAAVPGLRSPTGNIRCVYAAPTDARNRGGLFCTIGQAAYTSSLQSRCATVDWHGWTLSATGKGTIVCSGGALWFGTPHYVTVAYGRTWRAGPFSCASAVTGVTCRNRAGHGLFISRASWRAW